MDKSKRRGAPRPQSLCLEPLENRCLLAALHALPIALGPVLPAQTIFDHWKVALPQSSEGRAFDAPRGLGADNGARGPMSDRSKDFLSVALAEPVTDVLILVPGDQASRLDTEVLVHPDSSAIAAASAALWRDPPAPSAGADEPLSTEAAVGFGVIDTPMTPLRDPHSAVSVADGASQIVEGRDLSVRSFLAGTSVQVAVDNHGRSFVPAVAVTALTSDAAAQGQPGASSAATVAASQLLRAAAATDGARPNAPAAPHTVWGPAELSDRLAAMAAAVPDDVVAAAIEEQSGSLSLRVAGKPEATPPEQTAALIAGLLPIDLAALARNADKFFARLTKPSTGWVDPRLAFEVALWSVALAAGAYEVARLRSRKVTSPALADGDEISGFVMAADGDRE